jgi:hypothetical protein
MQFGIVPKGISHNSNQKIDIVWIHLVGRNYIVYYPANFILLDYLLLELPLYAYTT